MILVVVLTLLRNLKYSVRALSNELVDFDASLFSQMFSLGSNCLAINTAIIDTITYEHPYHKIRFSELQYDQFL